MMLDEVSVGTVGVCLWLGVREWSSGKFGGESGETFKKEGKGKRGFVGDSGYCIWEGQGKTKREQVARALRERQKIHAKA